MNNAVIFTRLFSIFLAVVLVMAPLSGAISNEYSKSKALTDNNDINSDETDVQIPENNSIKDKTESARKENDPIQDEKKDENGKDKENSRQELKDHLGSLNEDPAYPLILKQHALEKILSISSSENDRNKSSEKLGRARLHIEESIAGTLWYDETHLRSINEEQDDNDGTEIEQDDSSEQDDKEQEYDARTSVFRAEKKAAQNIMEAISNNKENTTNDDILIEAVENLVQADRNIAQIAITDAKHAASLYGSGLKENDDEENRDLEKAQKEFDKAVEKVQKGEPIDAIEHFEKAWEHAASIIFRLDAATKPVIVFDSINSRYINSTSVDLSGHVEDAAVYTISNITLEVNGLQSTLDLNNGTFGTILSLNEGSNYINATAIDIFGNTGVNNVTLIVDTIPPVISYNGAEDGRYYNTSVSVTANMTDENPDTLVMLVNGNPYTQGTPIIIESTYRFDIRARDLAGNTAESSFTFHIDMTPPEIRIFQPANNSFISGTAAVNITVKDASPVNTQAAADGLIPVAEIFDSTSYPDGVHYIAVDAVDAAGNAARESVYFIVDNTPPEVSILEPGSNEAIRGFREIIAQVYDLYLKSVTIFINDRAVSSTANHTFDTFNYSDGSYNISAQGVDLANNTGYDSISVIVDNTPPQVNITTPTNGSFVRQHTAVNASIIEVNPAITDVRIDGVSASGILPYMLDTLLYPDGLHTIQVYERDSAGNEGSGTASVIIDNTLPDIKITSPVNASLVRSMINVTADIFDLNLANITLAIDGIFVSNNSSYIWNSTGYADGLHRITAIAVDLAGNEAQEDVWIEVDNTAPLLIVNEVKENPTLDDPEYSLFIQTDQDANVIVNREPLNLINGSAIYSINISEGRNTFEIIASDALGNSAIWNITRLIDSDSLPDYYEISITGTDPLDGDSDSSRTPSNEAGNGILDDAEDFDGELLPTGIEMRLGTNPFSDDTDGDGLVDFFEAYFVGTNPIIVDTDGDGIKDENEDTDNDDLINIKEQYHGTDPDNSDTDSDDLYDGREIIMGTDPLDSDSDDDGLPDGMEAKTGSSPLIKDSDGDGIPDRKEIVTQEIKKGDIILTITGEGNIYNTLSISNISGLETFSDIPGNAGNVFDIRTNSTFETTTIKIPYEESALGDIPENDLKIFTINETTHRIIFLETTINTTGNYVQATANHFSIYGVAGYSKWMNIWNSGSNPTTPEFKMGDKINIKAQVHNTGDAAVNDNVPVYFYAGDPDAGGSYLGEYTITGGISKDGSKTAMLNGYTVTSSAVDIYVRIDPANSITEKSESNNKAYRTLSIGPQNFDSDGDGLTDWDETNGMRTFLGIIKTDPYNSDTDGDNLSDGIEMGMKFTEFYLLYSNPKLKDSDKDGLNDSEEYSQKTEPLLDKDSDNDGLWDGEEVHVTGTSPINKDTNGDGIWDGTEYLYSLGYTPQSNRAFINGNANNLLPAGSESPVTVEEIDIDMQSTLEMAYSLGFEGVKLFCLGDFAEGKISVSGAIDTGLCAADVGAIIIPADGPLGESAITSVKTARFIHGVKTWFNFQRVPNVLYKLQKANKALFRFKYIVNGKTEYISKELSKVAIQGASDLGIIWQKGAHGEILDAYGNLLKNYADDSGTIYYKVRELAGKNVLVKDMERVYVSGGDLKKTLNVVEKTEDGGSAIRWLEEGLTDAEAIKGYTKGGRGWRHILEHINDFKDKIGVSSPEEIQKIVMDSINNGERITIPASKGGGFEYIYEIAGGKIKTIVGSNGFIVTSYPI